MAARPTEPGPDLAGRLARVRLLALDVDGVLTDGRVVYGERDELQHFHVRDGHRIKLLAAEGIAVTWISGRGCEATRRRAAELGVVELHLRAGPKEEILAGVQERLGIAVDETAAMGDDLPDFGLARRAGVLACPADAHEAVRERADLVTVARGGEGAVSELAEHLLRARGRWQAIVDAAGG